MELDHLSEFLSAMAAAGIPPSSSAEIIPDDKKRRYHIAGDKPGVKNGSYQLKVEFEFAFGWFHSFKDGYTHKWNSKARKTYTPEEKAEFKKKLDSERKRKDREAKKEREDAAAKAVRIWARAVKDGETGYLQRKHCDLNGARVWKEILVVPGYNDINGDGKPQLATLQFISPDGSKRFITNGLKQGSYFPIAHKDDDKSLMIICEGFATGCSIRTATALPVIVAFDAGNLEPVARAMRKKYPLSRFIIAADHDQWTFRAGKKPEDIVPANIQGDDERWKKWRQAGLLQNTGIEKARQAAVAIGGAAVIWPEIPEDHKDKHTDFNDLFVTNGAENIKDRILSATPVVNAEGYGGGEVPDSSGFGTHSLPVTYTEEEMKTWLDEEVPLDSYTDEARQIVELYAAHEEQTDNRWRDRLYCDEKGKPKPKSMGNMRLFLENDRVLSKLFCYDKFAHEKIVYRCPPWENVANFKPRALNDDDITFLTCELEKRGILQPISTVARMNGAVIKNNARNPAKEYFESLKWDGTPRLDKWLAYYCGAEFDNAEYLAQIGRKWLTAAVSRVFEPGRKFDHIIIFEGPQNSGKSLMLKELATIHGTEYFDDTIRVSDLGNPNIVPKLQGVLIVEIAEMSGFKKKDVDELKQAITTTDDRIVLKYQNEASRFPRQFVFAGTINPIDGYLHDPTGNRRFWPVKVGRKIDIEAIKRDKEQLWAEAVKFYREGEPLYLDESVHKLAQNVQLDRNIMHPWFPDIEPLTRSRDTILVKEIWETLGITDKTKRTGFAAADISKIMTGLGFTHSRIRQDGERPYVWKRTTEPRELDLEGAEEIDVN